MTIKLFKKRCKPCVASFAMYCTKSFQSFFILTLPFSEILKERPVDLKFNTAFHKTVILFQCVITLTNRFSNTLSPYFPTENIRAKIFFECQKSIQELLKINSTKFENNPAVKSSSLKNLSPLSFNT